MNENLRAQADPIKVGIQGVKASFHDVAAVQYFAGRELIQIECPSFKVLGQKLESGAADYCLMAIENSIAGSILPNYTLMENHGFKILGEVYLRIEMNLMALPGQKLGDLRFVQSHPMALLQCQEFLAGYPELKVLEAADTAESAKDIHEKQMAGYAAIASRLAAETYGLELLAEGIETNKQNYTRFLVICRGEDYCQPNRADKASIRFELPDEPGALARILEVLSRHSVNMTKIQSVPILGRPYQYSFHVDLNWRDESQYLQALKQLESRVINLIHFGNYPKGERPKP
jgi:prephenate dehydratase